MTRSGRARHPAIARFYRHGKLPARLRLPARKSLFRYFCPCTDQLSSETWTRREHDVYEQDNNASRLLVLQGVKTAKLTPTDESRRQVGAVAMIKGGHQLSIDCIKGARPESPGGQIADDIEFVALANPDRQGGEE
jgi:hypothetical protein